MKHREIRSKYIRLQSASGVVAWHGYWRKIQLPYYQIWLNYSDREHPAESYQSVNPFSKVPGCVIVVWPDLLAWTTKKRTKRRAKKQRYNSLTFWSHLINNSVSVSRFLKNTFFAGVFQLGIALGCIVGGLVLRAETISYRDRRIRRSCESLLRRGGSVIGRGSSVLYRRDQN